MYQTGRLAHEWILSRTILPAMPGHTTLVDTGDGETLSSGLTAAESDTQDIEADRACLDQFIALIADHRDFDSMPTA